MAERDPGGREPGEAGREAGTVIWDRIGRVGRGPHPALTHERIAQAAVALADEEGIESLSMRKVAARLGAGTMSLYRYVDGKDDLMDLMVDDVHREVQREPRTGDWRADVTTFAREIRRLSLRHPWMAGVLYPAARPSFGPYLLQVLEHYLAAIDGIGLDIDAMLDTWMTVSAFVNGYVSAELAEREASRRSNLTQEQWRGRLAPYVRKIIDSGRYPLFTRIVVEAEDFPDPDVVFERRLGYVLDGLPANRAN
jgi:AcrR family transcriptional regulator